MQSSYAGMKITRCHYFLTITGTPDNSSGVCVCVAPSVCVRVCAHVYVCDHMLESGCISTLIDASSIQVVYIFDRSSYQVSEMSWLRQTDRQVDRQTGRQRKRDRDGDREAERETQTDRQTDRDIGSEK